MDQGERLAKLEERMVAIESRITRIDRLVMAVLMSIAGAVGTAIIELVIRKPV